MSKDKKNTKKNKLPEVKLSGSPKLILGSSLIQQITFLHSKVGGDEWSGILFYSVEGEVPNFDDMVFRANHLMLKDIGTPGYTSYEFDEGILDYFDQYPEAEELKIGMCHTHHSMGTSFSSTDMEELNENSEHHNYYLSLIVNFKAEYSAKLAFRGNSSAREVVVKGEDGNEKTILVGGDEEKLYIVDVDIEFDVDEYTLNQYNDILEEKKYKEAAKKQNQTSQYPVTYNGYGGNEYHNPYWNQRYGGGGYQQELPYHKSVNPFSSEYKVKRALSNFVLYDPMCTENQNFDAVISKLNETFSDASEIEIATYFEQIDDALDQVLLYHFGNATVDDVFEFCEAALAILIKMDDTPFVNQFREYLRDQIEIIELDEEKDDDKQREISGFRVV